MATDFNTPVPEILAKELAEMGLSVEQRAILDHWLAASPRNIELFRKMSSGRSLGQYEDIAAGVDGKSFIAHIERRWRRRTTGYFAGVGLAAAAIVVLALFVVRPSQRRDVLRSENTTMAVMTVAGHSVELTQADETSWTTLLPRQRGAQTITIEVPRGGEYKLRLLDGTQVWLNSGSSIEYPEEFADEDRRVRITGEAFFDVATDKQRPFIVSTADSMILTVLGTRFNVEGHSSSVISLVEGSVEVRGGDESRRLAPGQQATMQGGAVVVGTIEDMNEVTAWVDGRFYYRGKPVEEIFEALENWYDIDMEYSREQAARVGDVTFISSRENSLGEVLESLRRVTGMSYTIENEKINIVF